MDTKDMCEHTKIRLIVAVVGHQQCTKTAANIIQLPGTDCVIAIGTRNWIAANVDAAVSAAEKPTGDLTDEQIQDAVQGIYLSDFQDNPEGYDIAIARAAIAAHLASQSQAAQPSNDLREICDDWKSGIISGQESMWRVAAHLAGQSQATKVQAVPEGWKLVPLVASKDMLHAGMRYFHDKREPATKAWETYRDMIAAAPAAPTAQEVTQQAAKAETAEQATDEYETKLEQQVGALQRENDDLRTLLNTERARYFTEHGVLHDRVTGQHLWTQDQYDEQWRDMYKAGQEDATNGFNMLGKRNEEQPRPDDQGHAQDAQNDAGATSAGGGTGADEHHEHRARQSDHKHEHAGRDSGGAGVSGAVPVQAAEELARRCRAQRTNNNDNGNGSVIAPTTSTVSAPAEIRNAVLEEAAEKLDAMNDSSGDAAAYDQREQNIYELEREHAISDCAKAIRALRTDTGSPA